MNKWYYTWHTPSNTVSFFQTSEYEGKGGYDTKEEAIKVARESLQKRQRELTLSLMVKTGELSSLAYEAEQLGRTLLFLGKDS